jgi:hypothetical protein
MMVSHICGQLNSEERSLSQTLMHLLKLQLIFGVDVVSPKAESGRMTVATATTIKRRMNNLPFAGGPTNILTSTHGNFDPVTADDLQEGEFGPTLLF